jgi:hypothetical protein
LISQRDEERYAGFGRGKESAREVRVEIKIWPEGREI